MVPVVDGKRYRLQCMDSAHLALGARHVGVGEGEHYVLDDREARQQVEALEDKADAQGTHLGKLVVIELGHVESLQEVVASGWLVQATKDVHERRLTRAGGAGDGHELTWLHGQTHVMKDVRAAGFAFKDAMHVADVDDGAHYISS